jgi:hypothetical protein
MTFILYTVVTMTFTVISREVQLPSSLPVLIQARGKARENRDAAQHELEPPTALVDALPLIFPGRACLSSGGLKERSIYSESVHTAIDYNCRNFSEFVVHDRVASFVY